MEATVELKLMILPVLTSVTMIWYNVMTPLVSFIGGGAHDSDIEVELTGATATCCGGLDGAKCER